MRIAYVSLHRVRTMNSGVGKKIHRQISSWQAAGHEVKLFMHAARAGDTAQPLPGEIIYYSESNKLVSEWDRILAVYSLIKTVRLFKPDIIYLRYGMYVYPTHQLANIAPLVEEITTNDVVQHKGLGLIYGVYNRLTRGILIQATSGLVCLSNELANASYNVVFQKPTRVIGDGIDLNNVQPLPAPHNAQPQIAFMGSPGSPWQGVEKLIFLAKAFPEMGIHVIGYDQIDGIFQLPENVKLYGYLNAEEYKKVLAGMDCAVGSLALHRIQLNESSPLKTRECLALGLPMILAYNDTDLNGVKCDFLLKIPNKEDNIKAHAQVIYDFACQMRGRRVTRSQILHLDQAVKEAERIAFFKELLNVDP